jgi:hypothetical protein
MSLIPYNSMKLYVIKIEIFSSNLKYYGSIQKNKNNVGKQFWIL